jgi:threonylcarbamoyladenosine tRNA methylthiotransferase MtaB
VQNGCDHACTFCIIPAGRGPSRSRSIAEVVAEVRAHVDQGIMEIVLTAVDLTGWSRGGLRLGHLVAAILRDVPELPRLRLSSLDGVEIDPLLREIIAGRRGSCRICISRCNMAPT